MRASQTSTGFGDVWDGGGAAEVAQLLDLRARVPNVTCSGETQIRFEGLFLLVPPLGRQFPFVSRAQVTFGTPARHDPRCNGRSSTARGPTERWRASR
jgi:hypothetical protein